MRRLQKFLGMGNHGGKGWTKSWDCQTRSGDAPDPRRIPERNIPHEHHDQQGVCCCHIWGCQNLGDHLRLLQIPSSSSQDGEGGKGGASATGAEEQRIPAQYSSGTFNPFSLSSPSQTHSGIPRPISFFSHVWE